MSAENDHGGAAASGLATTGEQASALAALPDPLFIMRPVRDPGGTIVELTYAFLNEAAARLYGMSVNEVLGHGQCELFPSVKELGIWDSYLGVIESGTPACIDVPWFQENGVEGSFRLAVARFGDGLLISASDTTEQMAAQETADIDRAILRATIDSLIEPHLRFETVRGETGHPIDFVCEDANPAACEYYKMTHEELTGTRLLDLPDGPADASLKDMFQQVIETSAPLVLDDYIYRPEAAGVEERHFDIRATQVVGFRLVFTWRDVTGRYLSAEAARRTATAVKSPGRSHHERHP